jgi:hypothetical protein
MFVRSGTHSLTCRIVSPRSSTPFPFCSLAALWTWKIYSMNWNLEWNYSKLLVTWGKRHVNLPTFLVVRNESSRTSQAQSLHPAAIPVQSACFVDSLETSNITRSTFPIMIMHVNWWTNSSSTLFFLTREDVFLDASHSQYVVHNPQLILCLRPRSFLMRSEQDHV